MVDSAPVLAPANEGQELQTVSYDELMKLGSDARVEIVDGEIKEMTPTGWEHNDYAINIYMALRSPIVSGKLGLVASDGLIYLMGYTKPHLRNSLVPDVSYTAKAAIPADWDRKAPFPGVPTLAVEVASPTDDIQDLLLKVAKYLALGTDEVWVVYPRLKELHQYRRDTPNTIRIYRDADRIETPLLPTLELVLSHVFVNAMWF